MTHGQDSLGSSKSKSGQLDRKFCNKCHAWVYNEWVGSPLMATIVSTYDQVEMGPLLTELKPRLHLWYSSRIIDCPDGLPKYSDIPKEYGGTGDTINDSDRVNKF